MNNDNFNKILDNRLDSIKKILQIKNAEYSSENDRLYNFKRAGEIQRITPEKALLGMLSKHLVSVIDMIEIEDGYFNSLYIDEKITDSINYLILLEALLKEDLYKEEGGKEI